MMGEDASLEMVLKTSGLVKLLVAWSAVISEGTESGGATFAGELEPCHHGHPSVPVARPYRGG